MKDKSESRVSEYQRRPQNENCMINIDIKKIAPYASVSFVLLSCLFAFLVCNRQFGGYDLSPIIDLVWRLKNNESPGIDFINTMPPLFFLLLKVISLKELAWIDLTIINCVFAFCIYITMHIKEKNNPFFLFVISASISIQILFTNHLWHSSLSSTVGAFFVYNVCKFNKHLLNRHVLLVISIVLLLGTKQNVALPMFLSTLVMSPTYIKDGLKNYLACYIIAICVAIILYSAAGFGLESYKNIYMLVIGRVGETNEVLENIWRAQKTLLFEYSLLICLVVYIVYVEKLKYVFCYICFICALIPFATDWDFKYNNIQLPITVIGIILADIKQNNQSMKVFKYIFSVLLIVTVFSAAKGGYTRERMKAVGPFFETESTHVIHGGYFSGLKCGPHFSRLIEETHRVVTESDTTSIFFGPRVEFFYCIEKIRSPKHFPLWWHPGTSYALTDEHNLVQLFKETEFDLLVFAKNDTTRIPVQILKYINGKYTKAEGLNTIDVFVRNPTNLPAN